MFNSMMEMELMNVVLKMIQDIPKPGSYFEGAFHICDLDSKVFVSTLDYYFGEFEARFLLSGADATEFIEIQPPITTITVPNENFVDGGSQPEEIQIEAIHAYFGSEIAFTIKQDMLQSFLANYEDNGPIEFSIKSVFPSEGS